MIATTSKRQRKRMLTQLKEEADRSNGERTGQMEREQVRWRDLLTDYGFE